VSRMHERPQAALFGALRQLGCRVETENGNEKLPARIFGGGRRKPAPNEKNRRSLVARSPATVNVSIEESSQFASALLLCAKPGGWEIEVVGENAEESPYVAMTSKLIEMFPQKGGTFRIEPDASSGSYFLAAEQFLPHSPEHMEYAESWRMEVPTVRFSNVKVAHWPNSGWQMDESFTDYIYFEEHTRVMRELKRGKRMAPGAIKDIFANPSDWIISRKTDLGDSIMTAVAVAPLHEKASRYTDLGRLRLQECDRVSALKTELTKCGARVIEEGDTLTVYPSQLHGAEIETYNDHRMAMCFAVLGLKVPGIKIRNPACVKKTFPNFFQKLAAPPPQGLGATILDAKSGKKLEHDELFAD
jgi:3-phosphoshikimate 1-carboxyvinyltransferase